MEVNYVDHMGSDLSVVNAARVSFAKKKEVFDYKDLRLLRYLALHNHWTPFAHTALTLHIKAPIFVARQLGKHQVGLVWNEVSRRYVDEEPEVFVPKAWRGRPEDKKQGSSDKVIDWGQLSDDHNNVLYAARINSINAYDMLLGLGIAPEQARMVLPQATYTEWYWTGSLYAFYRVCNLRLQPDAQEETRQVVYEINSVCDEHFPNSWAALSLDNNDWEHYVEHTNSKFTNT